MYRNDETNRERRKKFEAKYENLVKVLQLSKTVQTRYQLIPPTSLNDVTVAGVRDTTLGRVKNGKPVGANVVRFSYPSEGTRSNFNRICIDPKGVSNKNNPHIKVSEGTISTAANVQKGLQVTGKVLFAMSIIASGFRVGKTIYSEVKIDDEVNAWKNTVDCLKEDLKKDRYNKKVRDALGTAKEFLDDAENCRRNPGMRTLMTSLITGGEWGVGYGGGLAGAEAGAAIGLTGGPVGGIAGAVVGGGVGAMAGTSLGGSAVENFKCKDGELSTVAHATLFAHEIPGPDELKEKWGNIRGNVYVGKGAEVGAEAAIMDLKCPGAEINLGKVGVNAGITDRGMDVSVEAKAVWTEFGDGKVSAGMGLNADTVAKVDARGAELSVLGLGFKAGKDIGIKTPIFNFTWKVWD